jgi:hypothetical protein
MLPILESNKRPSGAQQAAEALRTGINLFGEYQQHKAAQKAAEQENETLRSMGINAAGLSPEMKKVVVAEALKGQRQSERYNRLSGLIEGQQPQPGNIVEQNLENAQENIGQEGQLTPKATHRKIIPQDLINQVAIDDPQLANVLTRQNEIALKQEQAEQKLSQQKFEGERAYHSKYSLEQEKEAENLRSTRPKKTTALKFARDAVETGNLKYFSLDKIADATGVDLFRTAKGAQLVTAGKENLLSNMGRVSARAQNIWFEQRLNSMFPKIGQSEEANLTVQEMLEGEVMLDNAYLNEFDRIVEQDEKDYGFTKKDASKRARNNIKPLEKEILDRTSFRMKEIQEQEEGLSTLKSQVGKNVTKGTPLTLAMARLYKEKFGDNALDVAEKNGYRIPSIEEYRIYQSRFE